MATVTIGKPYFEALLRRAEFHTSSHEFDAFRNLSDTVIVSKAEHEYLLQAVRQYSLLKSALFRGGLTVEALETLLQSESEITHNDLVAYEDTNTWEDTFIKLKPMPVVMSVPGSSEAFPNSNNAAIGHGLPSSLQPPSYHQMYSSRYSDASFESPEKDDDLLKSSQPRIPVHDQRTLLISNLSDRTTHKDLVSIIKGGRLLDIFLRNDRTATISFVEGADDFLAYTKRNDIYLHTKRLAFRWNDRQFHVPLHVSNKIANGATRNLVVHGAVGKLTAEQIRDHLDHIHNLVVLDIKFQDNDAFISTNSIHNALFAKTCMMSRNTYKGLRIDWYPDECAVPLPKPSPRAQTPAQSLPVKSMSFTNRYTLLDLDGTEGDSDSDNSSYGASGIQVSNNWTNAVVA